VYCSALFLFPFWCKWGMSKSRGVDRSRNRIFGCNGKVGRERMLGKEAEDMDRPLAESSRASES